jgi:hypothetical protein
MTHTQRKSIKELLGMSSTEVREYLQTLPSPEQKTVGGELFKAMLMVDMQRSGHYFNHSQNKPT